jgi:hypothetical protein
MFYNRECKVIASNNKGSGNDFAQFKLTFTVKRTNRENPNSAIVKIYNLATNEYARFGTEYNTLTIIAGYQSNAGVIFTGNIKRAAIGYENSIDSYIEIACGDGDAAYVKSVIRTTIAAGSTQDDHIAAMTNAMKDHGVTSGVVSKSIPKAKLARGKTFFGLPKDYLRKIASALDADWSIQDGKLHMLKRDETLPVAAILIDGNSGLVGSPEQSKEGIKFRCLLNPTLKINGVVQLRPETISSSAKEKMKNLISVDGYYKIVDIEHVGDTRGNDWYCNVISRPINPAKKK